MTGSLRLSTAEPLVFARTHRDRYLRELEEWLSIASVSTDPAHGSEMEKAAVWLEAFLNRIGMQNVRRLATAGYPIVYGEWLDAGTTAPTVLAYGHYDVQPADPLEEWISPPFEPTQRGEDLFARGIADDKSQVLAMLLAAEAYLKTHGKLPVNFKVLVEGEEEISSPHIAECVQNHRELLATDAVLICDQPMVGPSMPAILYGVRGAVNLEIEVQGPSVDFHSGTAGGAIANPLNVLVKLLASMTDDAGRIVIDGFYDRVLPLTESERVLLAKSPISDAMIKQVTGVTAVTSEPGYTAAESMSVRPTLEFHGIVGGYTGPGKKSVIPAKVTAKLSCRLVPEQNPAEIGRLIQTHIRERTPATVTVDVRVVASSFPAVVPHDTPAVNAAARAYRLGFQSDPVYMRGGGSLPIVRDLIDELHSPVVLIGFGLPDDNVHAPNEKMHLPNLWRGIETVIHYFAEFADDIAGVKP